ncbi:GAF domain-containing protein [Nonlabens spongiae]|uniref:GAF domain-containing protein n=1 Tax=Nonlabens spongiae TaxID=331648 RepID=A0A1W6MH49_9FLAO|nr:GAF domain-containing protein [Nonlabens spongiae]ARN76915.1 GAF domain-containing protein [Nonlabens spongiae]
MVQTISNAMMDMTLSLKLVVENYRHRLEEESSNFKKLYLSSLLRFADQNEELVNGFHPDELEYHKEAISVLLSELFPRALTLNEIKAATVPFTDILFNKTERFNNILQDAGEDFRLELMDQRFFDTFRMACGVILNRLYDRQIDFSSPIFCNIPDKNGMNRTYRVTYNADFVRVNLNEGYKKLSVKKINELLRNPDDEDLWKNTFAKGAYSFEGFGILSLTDVTMDRAISDLKTILLGNTDGEFSKTLDIQRIFRNMFNLDFLRVGFTAFDSYDGNFESMFHESADSFILGESVEKRCDDVLCHHSYSTLIEEKKPLVITDVENYAKQLNNKHLTNQLANQKAKSAILYPIVDHNTLIGVLEVISRQKFALNSFNVRKIDSVAQYITAALIRTEQEYQNRVKALIQTECTSIHSSVQWKFAREARRILKIRTRTGRFEPFKDIRFPDVHPLYGQIDIVGSSDARNESIKQDLVDQLSYVCEIFASAKAIEPLPIYDQISYRVFEYQKELADGQINADSEREIIKLLTEEINPVVKHLENLSSELKEMVQHYKQKIDPTSGVIYSSRTIYDDTVQEINESLSNFIDRKQLEAQEICPHYFERFKTDGVEHNIYVGASIAPKVDFNVVYLYNLRLWQLKTMIEMENKFYSLQKDRKNLIQAASMILVFDNTLSIRYRIDEKRFDVDGTYNARYEVIKKRIDKAHIKGTDERVTQKGKIAIVYTNKETEREYQRYISFLQHNKMISNEVESLELEDVQGVIGLKALRVKVLYHITDHHEDYDGDAITYDTMIDQLNIPELNQ